MLKLILLKISFISIVIFRAVCSSWRTAGKGYIPSLSYHHVHQVPWLMLPQEQGGDDDNICFFSLQDKKVFKLLNTPQEFYNGVCLGSSHGWLVMLDENVDPYLFNPFSFAQIPLAKLETYPQIKSAYKSVDNGNSIELSHDYEYTKLHIKSAQDMRRDFISKAVVSSNISRNTGSFFVLMIFELGQDYNKSQLAFFCSGDNQWIRLGEINESYKDVVCHSDKFFALNYYKVEIWDVRASCAVKNTEILANLPQQTGGYLTNTHILRCYLV